ncbi:MAG: hypothetical protein COC19_03105 [SAR86 cluster bacterium]|uniref:Type II secretion system protein J n=1 Tax=SAR86 cluster bacterium TaxID=2030880 RepID=A0A2A4MQF2_9GAMM|nr:MAG: hypothetical protein COC19_03105 [SAR86 cluster bacterium]
MNNKPNKPIINSSQAGFTLLEIMLALGLTAMLLSLLSTSVYIVSEDWNRESDALDNSLDEALAVLQIDKALHGAFPHSYADEEALTRLIYFEGADDYLSWVSTVSPQRTPGLTAWELFSFEDGVYLKLVPAFSDNPQLRLDEAEPILILPNYDLSISYLYDELDETRQWREDWFGSEFLSLPLAVYIKFTPLDNDSDDEILEVVARIQNNLHRSIKAASIEVTQ